jgi:arylsulfatase A-like enzyme
MGYGDLSCFGSEVIQTPNIDSLAEQGKKFTSFYVHNRCTPTRAALMTGCKAGRVGLGTVAYWHDRKGIHPDEITVAELLKDAGYATGIIGKWHLGEWEEFNPVHHGFDYYYGLFTDPEGHKAFYENRKNVAPPDPDDNYGTKRLVPVALEFLRTHKDEPFFLYYASRIPHAKWKPHNDFKGSSQQGAYGDCVQQLDWATGQILNELETLGLTENTLVIFTSDNGAQLSAAGHGSCAPLRGGKWTHFEGGIRVPCIMKWPGKIAPGTENHEITAIVDILPTFGAIAGYDVPADRVIDGRNILPYMLGKDPRIPIHDTFVTSSTIRHREWKLYLKRVNPGGNGKGGMPGRTPAEEGSLFNLKEDIGETTDVSAQYPEKVQELKQLAEAYVQDYQAAIREPGYTKGYDAESALKFSREYKNNKKAKDKK